MYIRPNHARDILRHYRCNCGRELSGGSKVGTVGLLVMVCCKYISLAISSGFVMMSPFWFRMQSSG